MRPITPADLGQPKKTVSDDRFFDSPMALVPPNLVAIETHALTATTCALAANPNIATLPGGVTITPIVKTDYKGEKFGQTTTYEVRWAGGMAVCKTAEAAAQIALALSEKVAR